MDLLKEKGSTLDDWYHKMNPAEDWKECSVGQHSIHLTDCSLEIRVPDGREHKLQNEMVSIISPSS